MTHVVVIGAGAVGLSSAYFLASRGAKVTVLDAGCVGGEGASRWNAGWVVPAMSAPVPAPGMFWKSARWMLQRQGPLTIKPSLDPAFVAFMVRMLRHCNARDHEQGLRATVALNERTFELFDQLVASGVRFEQHLTGVTALFLSEKALHRHIAQSHEMEALGLSAAETLRTSELRKHSPAVSSRVVGGSRHADQRFLDPNSFVRGLHAACEDLGVVFRWGERATDFARVGGRVTAVRASKTYGADAFVLASGAWTAELAKALDLVVPIQWGKGYGYDLESLPGVRGALYLAEGKVAVTPMASHLRMAGTMEFTTDPRINKTRAEGILKTARRYLDLPATPPVMPWSGLRPMTPDGLPVIGRVQQDPNVVVAAGHGMLGITLAPVTGDVVTRILLDDHTPSEAHPFRLDRYSSRG